MHEKNGVAMTDTSSPVGVADGASSGAGSHFTQWVRRRVDRWNRNRRMIRELSRLDEYERACVLSDFGLTEQDLFAIASGPELPADLWRKVMARLGLDPQSTRAAPEVLRQLTRTCTTCSERRRCQRLLSAHAAPDDHHAFCPNAAAFDAMLSRTPTPAPRHP